MKYSDFFKKTSKEQSVLTENKKQAKLYVVQGKLSKEDFDTLVSIDPSPTKKYVGWMARQWKIGRAHV